MKIEKVWLDYKKTEKISLKQKLIENYISLVKIVAGRMYNYYASKIEYDDLVSYGIIGLIDSIDKFDIKKNVKFETYAQIRIKGSIIDNVRKLDWVPRTLRRKSKEIQDAIKKLENELGYTPTNQQIAKELGLPLKELEGLLSDVANFNISSLEEMLSNTSELFTYNHNDIETPEQAFESEEIKKILVEAIENLKKNESMVISLYYYEELTYKEIGHIMNLSESRISQIHSKAILNIKKDLVKQKVLNL